MFERSLLAAGVAAVAMSSALSSATMTRRARSADPTQGSPFAPRGSKSRYPYGGACKLVGASSLKKRMRHARRNSASEPSRAAIARHVHPRHKRAAGAA